MKKFGIKILIIINFIVLSILCVWACQTEIGMRIMICIGMIFLAILLTWVFRNESWHLKEFKQNKLEYIIMNGVCIFDFCVSILAGITGILAILAFFW